MITINGIEVATETPELSEFLRDWWQTYPTSQPPSGARQTRKQDRETPHEVLPEPYNWPLPPKLDFNQWYFPTSASRWGRGWFLANEDSINQMISSQPTDRVDPFDLVYGNTTFSGVYALTPIPVSGVSTSESPSSRLFLLPVVDKRYFWQVQCVTIADAHYASWAALLTALGVTSISTINASYVSPSKQEFEHLVENRAFLMDAVAASVGHKIVMEPDGTVRSQSTVDAKAILDNRRNNETRIIGATEPAIEHIHQIDMVFRRINKPECKVSDSNPHLVLTGSDDSGTSTSNRPCIYSSMFAEFPNDDEISTRPATPDNLAILQALADQYAQDYSDWMNERRENIVIPGTVADLRINGFDDHALYHLGQTSEAGGEQSPSTAIFAIPENLLNPAQLSGDPINCGDEPQDPDDPPTYCINNPHLEPCCSYRATAGGTVSPGGIGSASINGVTTYYVNWTNCTLAAGDRIIIVTDENCNPSATTCKCCDPPSCTCLYDDIYVCVDGYTESANEIIYICMPISDNCCEDWVCENKFVCVEFIQREVDPLCTKTTHQVKISLACGSVVNPATTETHTFDLSCTIADACHTINYTPSGYTCTIPIHFGNTATACDSVCEPCSGSSCDICEEPISIHYAAAPSGPTCRVYERDETDVTNTYDYDVVGTTAPFEFLAEDCGDIDCPAGGPYLTFDIQCDDSSGTGESFSGTAQMYCYEEIEPDVFALILVAQGTFSGVTLDLCDNPNGSAVVNIDMYNFDLPPTIECSISVTFKHGSKCA